MSTWVIDRYLTASESFREFLAALEWGNLDDAALFLGDAIREAAPEMSWEESNRIARQVVGAEEVRE